MHNARNISECAFVFKACVQPVFAALLQQAVQYTTLIGRVKANAIWQYAVDHWVHTHAYVF